MATSAHHLTYQAHLRARGPESELIPGITQTLWLMDLYRVSQEVGRTTLKGRPHQQWVAAPHFPLVAASQIVKRRPRNLYLLGPENVED